MHNKSISKVLSHIEPKPISRKSFYEESINKSEEKKSFEQSLRSLVSKKTELNKAQYSKIMKSSQRFQSEDSKSFH